MVVYEHQIRSIGCIYLQQNWFYIIENGEQKCKTIEKANTDLMLSHDLDCTASYTLL